MKIEDMRWRPIMWGLEGDTLAPVVLCLAQDAYVVLDTPADKLEDVSALRRCYTLNDALNLAAELAMSDEWQESMASHE